MSEKNLIVKGNKLIEARNALSLNEQKMILYTVSKIDRDAEKLTKVRVKVREFIDLLGTESVHRHDEIKAIGESLTKESIQIERPGGGWLVTTWLASIEYIPNKAEMELEFSEKLAPYLLNLKEYFTRYELQNIIYMKSKHSIKLYELLKQYQKIGVRRFSVESFREHMDVVDSYERAYDLEQHVIKTAVDEINELTDIRVEYEKEKNGRMISGYLFLVSSKDVEREIWSDYYDQYYEIKEIQKQMGLEEENLSSTQIISLYESACEGALSEDVDPFKYASLNYKYITQKKKNIKNMYAYLSGALKEDYANAGFILKL